MSLDIADAIINNEHIVIEAEVGIGKSFAYLVPLFYYHAYFRSPVIIATSTIALQEQLEEDIKALSEILKIRSVKAVIAKGQRHFICKKRFNDKIEKATESNSKEILNKIKKDMENNVSDRRHFNTPISDEIWNQINIKDYGYQKCDKCLWKDSCYYYDLRKELPQFNGIIICNQDLLTIDLLNQYNGRRAIINEKVAIIVIDEAHNLEEKVRNLRTESYDKSKISSILNKSTQIMSRFNIDYSKELEITIDNLDPIFQEISHQIDEQEKSKEENKNDIERFFLENTEVLNHSMNNLLDNLSVINDRVQINMDYDRVSENIKNIAEEIEELYEFMHSYIYLKGSNIFWLEKSYNTIYLYKCPKNIDREISRLYFRNSKKITILTSATLTDKNIGTDEERYSYFLRNTGFPLESKAPYKKGFLSEPKKSPFPYDKNAMIYVADRLPHPSKEKEKFIIEASDKIVELLAISNGKSLILFTSNKDMDEVYDILLQKDLPYKVLKQGQGGASHNEILERFHYDTNMVLLGSGSYSEGVNIPGESLSNLIIFKLPFPVPDPILEYKGSLVENAFMEVYVPEMLIKLKQGVGRLIRGEDDKGVVCILDPRLSKKSSASYKERVWDVLPIKNITHDIEELKEFYNQL